MIFIAQLWASVTVHRVEQCCPDQGRWSHCVQPHKQEFSQTQLWSGECDELRASPHTTQGRDCPWLPLLWAQQLDPWWGLLLGPSKPAHKTGEDCWENLSFPKKRGRKSISDAILPGGNSPTMCGFCSCDAFSPKGRMERQDCCINKKENMEENERGINFQNYAAMSPGATSVIPANLIPSLQYLLLLFRRWWSDVIGLCHVCHTFTSERGIYPLDYSGPDEFWVCLLPKETLKMFTMKVWHSSLHTCCTGIALCVSIHMVFTLEDLCPILHL